MTGERRYLMQDLRFYVGAHRHREVARKTEWGSKKQTMLSAHSALTRQRFNSNAKAPFGQMPIARSTTGDRGLAVQFKTTKLIHRHCGVQAVG